MNEFDFTTQGKRPSVSQIIARWKRAGKPAEFSVSYGETYAHFDLYLGRWRADGNGCRGVDRDAVEKALNKDETGR